MGLTSLSNHSIDYSYSGVPVEVEGSTGYQLVKTLLQPSANKYSTFPLGGGNFSNMTVLIMTEFTLFRTLNKFGSICELQWKQTLETKATYIPKI